MRAEKKYAHDDNEVIEAALDYIDRGWRPIPIPSRKKAPQENDWQTLKIKRSEVRDYFADPDGNIGVRLGTASDGLTDVDLDCDEALALADRLLPKTKAEFGRKSKPASHRLYRTDLAETEDRAVMSL